MEIKRRIPAETIRALYKLANRKGAIKHDKQRETYKSIERQSNPKVKTDSQPKGRQ